MREEGAVDLDLDAGKQSGGYQACLPLLACGPWGELDRFRT